MVEIRKMGPQIGVQVSGVDVRTLDDAGFAPIYQAWLDHNILVVTGQDLTIPEFLQYSRRFGHVTPHPSKSTRHPEYPDITLLGVNKFKPDGTLNKSIYARGAEGWHTDGAYDPIPFKATQLYALAIPDTGGDTLFASGYAAYQALPQRLKDPAGRCQRAVLLRWQQGEPIVAQSGRSRSPAGDPSNCARARRNGTQIALFRSRENPRDRGRRARRKQRSDRPTGNLHGSARRPVPPQMACWRHRDLGQSLFLSPSRRRLSAGAGSDPLACVDPGNPCRRIASPRSNGSRHSSNDVHRAASCRQAWNLGFPLTLTASMARAPALTRRRFRGQYPGFS